jgi:biopolymer transport protein ExbB/TolQ
MSFQNRSQPYAPPVHPIVAVATSPVLWGLAATVAFYLAIPYLPLNREFVARYFAGHWIEYATTGLFIIGLAELIKKVWGLNRERGVFSLLPTPLTSSIRTYGENLRSLDATLDRVPGGYRRTLLAQRLADVSEYLQGKSGAKSLEEHLRYLAELGSEQLHGSYALIRTLTWAIPILGFLGTVIGITMAIANITPDQLESALGEVTGGLAVAFDTTALSLALSMILVFATFVVEKWEGGLLSDVEQFGIRQLAGAFDEPVEASPMLAAERDAASELLAHSRAMISEQTGLWQAALDEMRQSWVEVAERQQGEFSGTLRQGMAATLADHARQLGDVRQELVGAAREIALELRDISDRIGDTQSSQQQAFATQVDLFWNRTQRELLGLHDALRQQSQAVVGRLEDAVAQWHDDLARATESLQGQLVALNHQGELLGSIVEDERQLIRLQDVLQQNLKTVSAAETFEETLHSLSAAVHLLTVRTRHAA